MERGRPTVRDPIWGEIYKMSLTALEWGLRAPITPRFGGNLGALPRLQGTEPKQQQKSDLKHKKSDRSRQIARTCSLGDDSCSRFQNSCSLGDDSCSRFQNSCSLGDDSCSQFQNCCSLADDSCSRFQNSCSLRDDSCSQFQNSCSLGDDSCFRF